jgi:predicted nucleotidyltransferase
MIRLIQQHNTHQNNSTLLKIRRNILAALAYFDMFNYPLTYSEIYLFLAEKHCHSELNEALNCLVGNKTIYQFDQFYSLKNDHQLITRRAKGNKKAAEMINKAKDVGSFLIKFPYVRGIGISGSLSKNFADDKSDIDLFIITEKNRLWVARTLMHCFKKFTFLVNRQHHYCMNYYIDEQQLQISEQNIYTAIEVNTLIPLEGDIMFEKFYAENTWTRNLLPNKSLRVSTAKPLRAHFLKSLIESLLNNKAGNALDNLLMRITAGRWNQKTLRKKLNQHGFILGMAAGKHFAKPDPVNFQSRLLTRYQNKLTNLLLQTEERVAQ